MERSMTVVPAGYMFLPTDKELVKHYLRPKVLGYPIEHDIIPEIDFLHYFDPMDIQERAFSSGDGNFYFYTKFDHPGMVSQYRRTGEFGYWDATGYTELPDDGRIIATKKAFIYYFNNTNLNITWTIYEYRLYESSTTSSGQQNPQQQWLLAKLENDQLKQEFYRQQLETRRRDYTDQLWLPKGGGGGGGGC